MTTTRACMRAPRGVPTACTFSGTYHQFNQVDLGILHHEPCTDARSIYWGAEASHSCAYGSGPEVLLPSKSRSVPTPPAARKLSVRCHPPRDGCDRPHYRAATTALGCRAASDDRQEAAVATPMRRPPPCRLAQHLCPTALAPSNRRCWALRSGFVDAAAEMHRHGTQRGGARTGGP